MVMLCTCRVAVLVFIFMLLMWCASGAALGALIVSHIVFKTLCTLIRLVTRSVQKFELLLWLYALLSVIFVSLKRLV